MNRVDKAMKITVILITIICLLPILMGVFYYEYITLGAIATIVIVPMIYSFALYKRGI